MEDPGRRFESHVDRTGEHHLWTAARDAVCGSGRLKVGRKHITAHRHAWELASDDPNKLREIAEKANRSSALRTGPFASVLDDFRALVRLVVAYARGLYRQIPIDRLVIVVGGSSTSSLRSM